MLESQKRAIKKYHDENYEYFKLRLNKGDKERIKNIADAEGKSMNQLILDRIFKESV